MIKEMIDKWDLNLRIVRMMARSKENYLSYLKGEKDMSSDWVNQLHELVMKDTLWLSNSQIQDIVNSE